jgi:hypothetical protein
MSSVRQAIRNTERILPGVMAPEGELDPRWQAIIAVGEHIPDNPQEVWGFIRKWGKHPNEDLRTAIATCLLEHLLEYHFEDFFPMVKETCRQSKRFALTFKRCCQFGQAKLNKNSKAFIALKNELGLRCLF